MAHRDSAKRIVSTWWILNATAVCILTAIEIALHTFIAPDNAVIWEDVNGGVFIAVLCTSVGLLYVAGNCGIPFERWYTKAALILWLLGIGLLVFIATLSAFAFLGG